MMYPILYPKNSEPITTGASYDLGLGVLDEARSIKVIEELNGVFTLTLMYPATGRLYNSIERGCLLMCKSNPYSGPQLFRIQEIIRPMNGVIEIYATHKSYDLSGYVLKPCSYNSLGALIGDINNKLIGQTPIPWTWQTDMASSKAFSITYPVSARNILGSDDGSIVKIYGGELEFDNNTIKLLAHRGTNRGVTIRYGHNLIDFRQEELFEQCYTDVLPYWTKDVYDESASTPENPVYHTTTVMPDNPISTHGGWGEVTMPEESTWESVCYGDGKFVAVSRNSDLAAVSDDGVNWSITLLPESAKWASVCYGEGKFVAVASDSNIAAYSYDGISWRKSRLPSTVWWSRVCHGSDRFIAIASSTNVAAYSIDGTSWVATTMPSSGAWDSICYGDGKFVALSYGSNAKAARSANGVSWTETSIPAKAWHSVCFGDNKFVAAGYNYDKALTSSDGITWVERNLPRSSTWFAACYGDSEFVILDGSKIARSSSGITWTETSLPSSQTWVSVCYGNGKYVVISEESKTIYTIPPERKHILTLDCSTSFDDNVVPTVEQLETLAEDYIITQHIGVPEVKMTVNFVDLSKTTEYRNLTSEIIKLGDTINVVFERYGVNTTAEVIKATYDPIKDTYSEIELGNRVDDFASTIQSIATPKFEKVEAAVAQTKSDMEKAVAHANELITSGSGGQVILHVTDSSGKPSELLILSRDDSIPPTLDNATGVWRWNKNGLAYSDSGYSPGNYGVAAITKDGHIVADTINLNTANITGRLSAGYIGAGIIDGDIVAVNDAFQVKMDVDGVSTLVGYVGGATGMDGYGNITRGAMLKSPDSNSYVIVTNAGVRLQVGTYSFFVTDEGISYVLNGGPVTPIGGEAIAKFG